MGDGGRVASWIYDLTEPPVTDPVELAASFGAKGASLATMLNELDLPVPPGFVITTAACRAYLETGWPDGLDDELRQHMTAIEETDGRRFGDPRRPLLISVRSAAPVSMPGMLDTVLDVGLNDETTAGLAQVTGDGLFAARHRGRLTATYRDSVGTADVPDDPWVQLRLAIEGAFRSWLGDRASGYREKEGIDDVLGAAVVVQVMVFGDRDDESATGVLLTRDPTTGEDRFTGDVRFGPWVDGSGGSTHPVDPVAVIDERLPAVASDLRSYAHTLERHYADVCDIEFTIERGRLWLLHARIGRRGAQAALRMALEMAADESFPLSKEQALERVAAILADPPLSVSADRDVVVPIVATGLAASPGLGIGVIATSSASALAKVAAGRDVIFVSRETSTEDVRAIARAAGILTTRGGLTSHAAVVARGWHIPAVVGAADVNVEGHRVSIGARLWREGDEISIDGSTGDVFGQGIEVRTSVVPEASTLLGWAAQLGVDVGAPATADGVTGRVRPERSVAVGGVGRLEILQALLTKGHAGAASLAMAISVPEDVAAAALDELRADGFVRASGDMFGLTAKGRDVATSGLDDDRLDLGLPEAVAAMDAFTAFDERSRALLTAWRMREIDGARILNDHTDATYDGVVLDDLRRLHAEVVAFMRPLVVALPRLGRYVARLERALSTATGGDDLYVASTRVDSYHVVWRDLHHDFVLLSGAGRDSMADDETVARDDRGERVDGTRA